MWDLIVSVPDRCLSFYFSYVLGGRRPGSVMWVPYGCRTFSYEVNMSVVSYGCFLPLNFHRRQC